MIVKIEIGYNDSDKFGFSACQDSAYFIFLISQLVQSAVSYTHLDVYKRQTVFLSDESLLKMLYLAMVDITKKWTGHRQDWGQIHSQLEIFFEERLSGL